MSIGTAQGRILLAVIVAHLCFFATALVVRPKVDSDAAAGMLVWRSMERGAHWNSAIEPDPADIARDRQSFMTWWSPGQYLAVGPLHSLGASWGASIATATLLCSLSGLLGYWWLYRSLGFAPATSAWAAGILAVAWQVTRNYGEFSGGELALLAVAPWLVGCIMRLRPLRLIGVLPFACIYLVGAMTKLSFCVTAAAALAGICCVEFAEAPGFRRLVGVGARAAAMMLAAHLLLWLVFLRHGANPSSIGAHGLPWWYVLPAVLVLPAGSALGMGSLLSRLFLFPGHALVAGPTSLAPLLWALVLVVAAAYWALARRTRLPRDYGLLVAGMAGTYAVVLGSLIVAGAPISLEDRQFFPVGALIIPALVELARSGTAEAWRWTARAALLFASAYGLVALVVHARQNLRTANVGRSGFTQHIVSPRAMSVLHFLDDGDPGSAAGTLVYVPSPEISFELQHARVLSTFDLALSPEELRRRTRRGRVPLLVVLSNPVLESQGRDAIVMRSFADYSPSEWKEHRVGEWTFHYQGAWPPGGRDDPMDETHQATE
jgi:hypothetical protein